MAAIIEIPLQKRKTAGIYVLAGASLGCAIGFSMLSRYLMIQFLPGAGVTGLIFIVSLLLFVFSLWAIYRLHHDGNTGLYISDTGVTDISTGYRIGTVLWQDVTKIKIMDDLECPEYRYVVLRVKNPNEYIAQEPTRIKKRSLTLKLHQYGSPVCISARALDCTFEELRHLIESRYAAYLKRQERKKEVPCQPA